MTKLHEKINKAWRKWGDNYYKENENELKSELSVYEEVTNRSVDSELYAIELFNGMNEQDKSNLISLPFYELLRRVVHESNISNFEVKLSMEKFLSGCWKAYEEKLEKNQSSAKMLEMLSVSTQDGGRIYLTNIPIGMLFECELFKRSGNLKTSDVDKMQKFCSKLLEYYLIFIKQKDKVKEMQKERDEILKMKELLERDYMRRFSIEYEECIKIETNNIPIEYAVLELKRASACIKKAQIELDEKTIEQSLTNELNKYISNKNEESRDFNSYKSRSKFLFDEIMQEIEYLCKESRDREEMTALIPLNKTCRLCKKYPFPAIPEILLDRYKTEITNMMNRFHNDNVISIFSSVYSLMLQASNHFSPDNESDSSSSSILKSNENCIRFKRILKVKPEILRDNQADSHTEENEKKQRKEDDTVQLIDTMLKEAAQLDAYFIAYLIISEVNKCKSMNEIKDVVKKKDIFFADNNKSIYIKHHMEDIIRKLKTVDINQFINSPVQKTHINNYRLKLHKYNTITEDMIKEISSEIKQYKKKSDSVDKNSTLIVTPVKFNEMKSTLLCFIEAIKKKNLNNADIDKLTFVKDVISKKNSNIMPLNDLWNLVFKVIKICIKNNI